MVFLFHSLKGYKAALAFKNRLSSKKWSYDFLSFLDLYYYF